MFSFGAKWVKIFVQTNNQSDAEYTTASLKCNMWSFHKAIVFWRKIFVITFSIIPCYGNVTGSWNKLSILTKTSSFHNINIIAADSFVT